MKLHILQLNWHLKLLCVLMFALKLRMPRSDWICDDEGYSTASHHYALHLENDIKFCADCFASQFKECLEFYKQIEFDAAYFYNNLFMLLSNGKRQVHWLRFKDNKKPLIGKYFAQSQQQLLEEQLLEDQFVRESASKLYGLQLCCPKSVKRFVELLKAVNKWPDNATTLLFMLGNVQPLLMPVLAAHDLPVPQTYANCGFASFQQNAGQMLSHYFTAHTGLKMQILQQLLQAVMQFTIGLQGFRFYLSDLRADNLVFDAKQQRLSFVDLDNILVLDSKQLDNAAAPQHVQEYIACAGDCFAYEQQSACAAQQSDLNYLAVCQFLWNEGKALLAEHKQLQTQLRKCIFNEQKLNESLRYQAVKDMLQIIAQQMSEIQKV